jgi:hypothetical protein
MEFRRSQLWEREALVRALQTPEVLNGVARCIQEERALIVQMVRRRTTGRVTVVQYPVAGVQEAYDRLKELGMEASDFVAYFIVASSQAITQAEVDGTPYMRTLRPAGAHQAEILRVPYALQTERADRD